MHIQLALTLTLRRPVRRRKRAAPLFKRKRIDLEQARGALKSFREIPVRLGEIDLEAAVELAKEKNIYAYDAYILECARRYRTPLLSLDGPQRRIAEEMGIEVLEV